MDTKKTIDIDDIENHEEYEAKLYIYLKLKTEYEDNYRKQYNKIKRDKDLSNTQKRAQIRNIKQRCINCQKKVNTIFEEKDRQYIARCGDIKEPCKLDIRIQKPVVVNYVDEYLKIEKNKQELDTQTQILKLKYIFNHINDEQLETSFKQITNEKKVVDELYELIHTEIEKSRKTTEKEEQIKHLKQTIENEKQAINSLYNEYLLLSNMTTDTANKQFKKIMREIAEHTQDIHLYNKEYRNKLNDINKIEKIETNHGNGTIIKYFKEKYTNEHNHVFIEPYDIRAFSISLTTK